MLKRIKGGSSESELNELTVRPSRSPERAMLVTTTTPEANRERVSRNWRLENHGAFKMIAPLSLVRRSGKGHRNSATGDTHASRGGRTVAAAAGETPVPA